MEYQILKIITDNHGTEIAFSEDAGKTAKEIAEHFEEFIEWKDRNTYSSSIQKTGVNDRLYIIYQVGGLFNIKELYSYWIDNVEE